MPHREPGDPQAGNQGRSRLEDEVLEILVRADQPTSLKDHIRRKARRDRAARLSQWRRGVPRPKQGVGPGTLLVGSLAFAFVASAVRDSSALLAELLAAGSVALLIAIYVVRYRSPGRSDVKQWRGRDIDVNPSPPAWVESLKQRFRRPPRR